MAQRYLELDAPRYRDPVVDPQRGFVLSHQWETWIQRLYQLVFKRPSCFLYFTADQSHATSGAYQDVTWSAEDHDNANMHSTAGSTDEIVIPSPGMYSFGAFLIWGNANAIGDRGLAITLNATSPPAASAMLTDDLGVATSPSTNYTRSRASGHRQLSAADVLRVASFQSSTAALNMLGTTNGIRANGFWCFKVSNA